MSEIVNLTVITSAAGNKAVKPDVNGYYRVTLGAFNVKNSAGEAYSFSGVPELLANKTNILNRRLLAGRLRSEADHPVLEPGMTQEQFVMRNLQIPVANCAAHIKELKIIETSASENIPGLGNIVLVEGLVKPSGVHGNALKDSLDNPDEDTCFSIRCFTKDVITGLLKTKYVKQIVTWDWVNEPGIKYASKLGKPAVESEDILCCDLSQLKLPSVSFSSNPSTEAQDVIDGMSELILSCETKDILDRW